LPYRKEAEKGNILVTVISVYRLKAGDLAALIFALRLSFIPRRDTLRVGSVLHIAHLIKMSSCTVGSVNPNISLRDLQIHPSSAGTQ
jgi:hypothetical protein